MRPAPVKCIFSVDVEDWFHILDVPSTPPLSQWDSLPSYVEKNFRRLLDLFAQNNTRATCFFLGWVARKFPHLLREADQHGHEIASHGYSHRLIYEMTPQEFLQDSIRAKAVIEDTIGHRILGYRAAGFSVTQNTPWFFDKLIEAGYRYDSSVFPASRGHGGIDNGRYAPYFIGSFSEGLIEFPVTITRIFSKPVCFFGGGYLRLFPFSLIKRMALKVLREGRPVVFYVHPREIDPDQPRLPMNLRRELQSYINVKGTEAKLKSLLTQLELTTFERFIAENRNQLVCTNHALVPALSSATIRQASDRWPRQL